MQSKKVLLIVGLSATVVIVVIVAGFTLQPESTVPANNAVTPTDTSTNNQGGGKYNNVIGDFAFTELEYDFGVVKQSQNIVQHDFPFIYNGSQPIEITGAPTSCSCTSAAVDKATLQPGDTGVLTVSFDPNLHAEPEGKFFKTISFLTAPAATPAPEVKIWAEIDLDLGPEAYKLKEHAD